MTAPSDLYSINWFPTVGGGWQMWTSYDGPRASAGGGQSLGFGCTARPWPRRRGRSASPSHGACRATNLTDFCDRDQFAGVQLHLSLFDMQPNIGYLAASKVWAEAVVSAITDLRVLAVIEIKNELPYAQTMRYTGKFDAGWSAGPPRAEVGRLDLWPGLCR